MKRAMIAVIALSLGACHPKPITDPHVAGANKNQWRAILAVPSDRAFSAAMQVLVDSSYQVASATKDAGLIKTAYRKESEVQRGRAQLKTMALGSDYPIRLQLVILPTGKDSSTVTITGEQLLENIAQTMQIPAHENSWRFVRGIGEAIIATAR